MNGHKKNGEVTLNRQQQAHQGTLGTFAGVFTPSILTILGIILFLRLGYVVGQNFGEIFDVRAEPDPTDLAYTTIELLAHTDQPYRHPVPGIQV